MAKLLRINTRTKEFSFEETGDYTGLGGRALTSRVIRTEVPPTCHPLSAQNKLVFAPGALTGTRAANSGRISVGAKSPLTEGIKESNSGGVVSQKLAKMGIAGIILEDKPEPNAPLITIKVTKDNVVIEDAPATNGTTTYEYAEILNEKFGGKAIVAMIGIAGEKCLKASTIQFTDPTGLPARSAGRGGMGAVMGSKRVKALVIDDTDAPGVEYVDDEAFKTASKRWAEILRTHPITGEGLPGFGTSVLVNVINEAGALPTKNFRGGRFEHAADISGEAMVEIINKRGGKAKEGCHPGCIIQCSQRYLDKDGEYLTSGFEYETVWAFGANSLIKDYDHIATLDRACDNWGVDTIEMGCTLAVAMDAGLVEWGDGEGAIELLNKIGKDDPLGNIFGNGAKFLGDAYGVDRIPVVKNQSMPAYDPRAVKGVGVTYATSPMGADHTAGYAVAQNVLKCGGDVDGLDKAGQVELSQGLQIATAAIDAAGFCLFVAFAVLDTADALNVICDLLNSRYGLSTTPDDIMAIGKGVLKDEFEFNELAGFTKVDDEMPLFMQEELPPHNVKWDITVDEMQAVKAL